MFKNIGEYDAIKILPRKINFPVEPVQIGLNHTIESRPSLGRKLRIVFDARDSPPQSRSSQTCPQRTIAAADIKNVLRLSRHHQKHIGTCRGVSSLAQLVCLIAQCNLTSVAKEAKLYLQAELV